jgi:hypothetical protein
MPVLRNEPRRRSPIAGLAKGALMKNTISIVWFARTFAFGLIFGLPALPVHAQTNLVANGSFETGPAGVNTFSGGWFIGPADNNSDFGVATSGVYPDVAEQGTNYAYFRGHPTDDSQDCLGINVNLTVGALYNISFYFGTDGPTAGTGAAMWAVIGPSFGIDYSVDTSLAAYFPNSSNAIPYQLFSTTYLATSIQPTLSFHGINGTNAATANGGILMDNVSMTLIYPPLSIGLSPTNTLTLTWPYTNSPYRLTTATSLTSTNWTLINTTPANIGTNSQVSLPAPSGTHFYRLTLPQG